MTKKEKKIFEKQRNIVIKVLEKIEKKFGSKMFRSAVNRKLMIDRETQKRNVAIARMEKELEKLKKGQTL